tara:strand:- start:345 stop:587 length:243 start_codon:yes stop_codon:yes gene_type:complete
MSDRNSLLQEKAEQMKQQKAIIDEANAKIEAVKVETEEALSPIQNRIAAINSELLNDLDAEAGISHEVPNQTPSSEASPA